MKHHKIRRRMSGLMAAVLLLLTVPAQAASRPRIDRPSDILPQTASKTDQKEEENQVEEEAEETDSEPAAEEEAVVQEKERPEGELSGPEILANTQVIAHGMGEIDGIEILNCLEGFEAMYEAGVRVFEVDLRLTRDAKVVLRHDWRSGWQPGVNEAIIPTLEDFLSMKLLDKYTPLSFRDLLLLMEEYPDICIITDTKFTEADVFLVEFDAMVADAKDLGLSYLFDRMIFQIYNKNMFTTLYTEYGFTHYIYTLYNEGFQQTAAAFRDKAIFCSQHGIGGITMWDYWWKPSYAAIAEEYGVHVYVHTVNNVEKSKSFSPAALMPFIRTP